MEYRYTAWVHPKSGGDDYSISGKIVLTGGIEDAEKDLKVVRRAIRAILKKENSAVLTDYDITFS